MTSIWDLSDVKLRPGWYTAIVEANDGCDCSTVAATSSRNHEFLYTMPDR